MEASAEQVVKALSRTAACYQRQGMSTVAEAFLQASPEDDRSIEEAFEAAGRADAAAELRANN